MIKTRNKRQISLETDLVKAEILRRGLTEADVARLTKMAVSTLRYELRTNFRSQHFRDLVEARVFGYEVPVWSTAVELKARRDALERIGSDPAIIGREELMSFCKRVGVEGNLVRDRAETLVSKLLGALGANPRFRLTTSPAQVS